MRAQEMFDTANWAVRVVTPTALSLAGLYGDAEALRWLAPVTDEATARAASYAAERAAAAAQMSDDSGVMFAAHVVALYASLVAGMGPGSDGAVEDMVDPDFICGALLQAWRAESAIFGAGT